MSPLLRVAVCALVAAAGCARRPPTWCAELVAGLAAGTLDRAGAARVLGVPPDRDPDDHTRVASQRAGIAEAMATRHPALPPSEFVVDVLLAPTQPIPLADLERAYGASRAVPIASANFHVIQNVLMTFHPTGAPYEVRISATLCRDPRTVCSLYFDRNPRP